MSRDLSDNLTAILAADEKAPVHLYRLTLSNVTLRFAASTEDVEFPAGGEIWTGKKIKHESPNNAIESSQVGKSKVCFADGNQAILGYHQADNLKGKKIEVIRIYRSALDSEEDQLDLMVGYITNVAWDYQWFVVEVSIGDTLRQKHPRRPYLATCPWYPGGAECNADGLFDISQTPFLQSGTAEGASESGDQIYDSNRTEDQDYWKNGLLILTVNGKRLRRGCTGFSGGIFDLDFPVSIDIGDEVEYTIQRGCDGLYATCQGGAAYGPSSDNSANFGGFLHITEAEQG